MARYDALLDSEGGYAHEDADANILTEEELELWRLETQAEIDADFDARYDQYMALPDRDGALTIIAASRHVDPSQPPY